MVAGGGGTSQNLQPQLREAIVVVLEWRRVKLSNRHGEALHEAGTLERQDVSSEEEQHEISVQRHRMSLNTRASMYVANRYGTGTAMLYCHLSPDAATEALHVINA
jgi:hypothetical protein